MDISDYSGRVELVRYCRTFFAGLHAAPKAGMDVRQFGSVKRVTMQPMAYTENIIQAELPMTITKADLVQRIYESNPNLIKSQAVEMVEAFLRLSKTPLIEGADLLLSGFGKFCVHDKKARRGRNP